MRILNRITNKRTQGGVHHIRNNNIITLVVDITENKVDPVFSTTKWGQVKGKEKLFMFTQRLLSKAKASRTAKNKVSRLNLRIYYDSHLYLANLGSYYRISS